MFLPLVWALTFLFFSFGRALPNVCGTCQTSVLYQTTVVIQTVLVNGNYAVQTAPGGVISIQSAQASINTFITTASVQVATTIITSCPAFLVSASPAFFTSLQSAGAPANVLSGVANAGASTPTVIVSTTATTTTTVAAGLDTPAGVVVSPDPVGVTTPAGNQAVTPVTPIATVLPDAGFLIGVATIGARKRQLPAAGGAFLTTSGSVVSQCSSGDGFAIIGDTLTSSGLTVSLSSATGPQPFLASAGGGGITESFSVQGSTLVWVNSAFSTGTASFCVLDGQVQVILDGSIPTGCQAVSLMVVPASACPTTIPPVATTPYYSNVTSSQTIASSQSTDSPVLMPSSTASTTSSLSAVSSSQIISSSGISTTSSLSPTSSSKITSSSSVSTTSTVTSTSSSQPYFTSTTYVAGASQTSTTTIDHEILVAIGVDSVTTTSFLAPSASAFTSTILPSGSVSGTVVIGQPVGYVRTTTFLDGDTTDLGYTSTIAPTGPVSGTLVVGDPVGYVTTTSYLDGSAASAAFTSTVLPTGSVSGTVIVGSPIGYATTTTTYVTGTTGYTSTITPTGAVSGTVIDAFVATTVTRTITTPYAVLTSTTIAQQGATPATVQITVPSPFVIRISNGSYNSPYLYASLASGYSFLTSLTEQATLFNLDTSGHLVVAGTPSGLPKSVMSTFTQDSTTGSPWLARIAEPNVLASVCSFTPTLNNPTGLSCNVPSYSDSVFVCGREFYLGPYLATPQNNAQCQGPFGIQAVFGR